MKRYSTYKDSGVEWMFKIPFHWKSSKVKFESTIIGRIGFRGYTTQDIVNEGEGVISLSPSNITKDYKLDLSDSTYLSYEKYHESPEIKVYEDDIILVKTSSIGKITIIEGDKIPELTLNPQLVVLKNIRPLNKFIYYYLISPNFQYELNNEKGGGVTPTISQEKINNFQLLVPPLSEQQKIVEFLDDKTQKIDNLIKQKEKKIELLKEKRTSLINHVVTKGLNPNVEMKDSGVEWIGKIPSHWNIKKLKHIIDENTSSLPNSTNPNYELEYIEISDVNSEGKINSPTQYLFSDSPSRCRRIVKKGDLIVSTVRTYLKSIGLIENDVQNLICSTGFSVLSPKQGVVSKHLFYMLRTEWFISMVISYSEGVSYPSIQSDKLINIPIIHLSVEEQQQIVDYLDEQTKEIDDLVELEQKKIELLKEYRQSLISEVVTGKIRVCEEDLSEIN